MGPLARIIGARDCTRAVALQFRLAAVFPAAPGAASPPGGQSVFPAARGRAGERSVILWIMRRAVKIFPKLDIHQFFFLRFPLYYSQTERKD